MGTFIVTLLVLALVGFFVYAGMSAVKEGITGIPVAPKIPPVQQEVKSGPTQVNTSQGKGDGVIKVKGVQINMNDLPLNRGYQAKVSWIMGHGTKLMRREAEEVLGAWEEHQSKKAIDEAATKEAA